MEREEREPDGWGDLLKNVRAGVEEKRAAEVIEGFEKQYEEIFGDIPDVDVKEDPELENGQRKVKKMMDPKLPTAEEVRQQNITHMPHTG